MLRVVVALSYFRPVSPLELIDECGDWLRQRRANCEYGDSADEAEARPASVVEYCYQ